MMGLPAQKKDPSAGSITLEASLILPWIVMMTFLLLLFALFISQGALLYYSSSMLAERSAFSWSNSAKATKTGAYPQGQYDGLYWRLTDDSLVHGLFGLVSEREGIQVSLYSGMEGNGGASAKDKLKRVGMELTSTQEGLTGVISYRNIGIMRQVEVRLKSSWLPTPLAWLRGEEPAIANSSALVVEPAEFIRSFDLLRYYGAKLQSVTGGKEAYKGKAAEVLRKRGG